MPTETGRDFLKWAGLEHVFTPDAPDATDRVWEITAGRGVDAVLDAGGGEAWDRGARLLARAGRFVVVADSDRVLGEVPLRASRTFHRVDLAEMLDSPSDPDSAAIVAEVAERIRTGDYRPLPYHDFSVSQVMDALASLRDPRGIGAAVLRCDGPVAPAPPDGPLVLDPAGTYLVTGGLTGLGAATAQRLADRGARHLALLGRRGGDTPGAAVMLAQLAARGVTAVAHPVDVADPVAVRHVLATIEATGYPLRGVVHAATEFGDTTVLDAEAHDIRMQLRTKVGGGWVVDTLTRGLGLDFFVVYSSVLAMIGDRSAAGYVAANLAAEALVLRRCAAGEHGLAVEWGVIGDVGVVAENRVRIRENAGWTWMPAAAALGALEQLLARQATGVVTVGEIRWDELRRTRHGVDVPRWARFYRDAPAPSEIAAALRDVLPTLSPDDAIAAMTDVVTGLLATTLQTCRGRLDRTRRLENLGLDSLMATKISVTLERSVGCVITANDILAAEGIDALTRQILSRIRTDS